MFYLENMVLNNTSHNLTKPLKENINQIIIDFNLIVIIIKGENKN
jgi:hypothetical protein